MQTHTTKYHIVQFLRLKLSFT